MAIKIKTVRVKATPNKQKVDRLAQEYLDAQRDAKEKGYLLDFRRKEILEYADSRVGEDTPKGRIVKGNKWQVGYTAMYASPVVDVAALKKKFPALAKKVVKQVVTEEVDNDAFTVLVETGKISPADAQTLLVEGGLRGKRVVVETIKD